MPGCFISRWYEERRQLSQAAKVRLPSQRGTQSAQGFDSHVIWFWEARHSHLIRFGNRGCFVDSIRLCSQFTTARTALHKFPFPEADRFTWQSPTFPFALFTFAALLRA